MAFAKVLDAVVCVYNVLKRLRAIRHTCYVCECDGGSRDGKGRSAEVRHPGEGRIAAIIHDVKAANTVVVVVVGQEFVEVTRLVFDGDTKRDVFLVIRRWQRRKCDS